MRTPVQKRTLETRAKLIDAAQKLVAESDYAALRIEDVVKGAGVAKGTFFAHFRDKDALMDRMIGAEIDRYLDELAEAPAPTDLEGLIEQLLPMLNFMISERYVFDVIIRHSGAAQRETIGPIALTFERQHKVMTDWLDVGPFRKDVSAALLADGVQAFTTHGMALHFCAINGEMSLKDRLTQHLSAWLHPS